MIEQLWSTPVIEDQLDLDRPADTQLLEAARAVAGALGFEAELLMTFDVQAKFKPADTVTLGSQTGLIRSVLFEVVLGTVQDEHSGAVSLHDPRAGAGMVVMPGLPWGRPHTVAAVPGHFIVFPAWLSWTVLPLVAEHQITMRSSGYSLVDAAVAL